MGTAYGGLSATISPPASVAISSSTAGPPAVVNTSTAHGLLTGDYVDIEGHQTNTAINGVQGPVTVTGTTQFTIPITGSGTGAATGSVQSVIFTNNVSLNPANGDALSASTWIPGMACLADRTAFLVRNLGAYKLVSITKFINDNDNPATATWTSNPPSATNTWTLINGSAPAGYPLTVLNCVPGDILEFDFAGTIAPSGNSSISYQKMAIMASFYPPGGSPTFFKVAGSGQNLPFGGAGPSVVNFNLKGYTAFSGASAFLGQFGIGIYQSGTTGSVALESDATLVVCQYRSTSWPQ